METVISRLRNISANEGLSSLKTTPGCWTRSLYSPVYSSGADNCPLVHFRSYRFKRQTPSMLCSSFDCCSCFIFYECGKVVPKYSHRQYLRQVRFRGNWRGRFLWFVMIPDVCRVVLHLCARTSVIH